MRNSKKEPLLVICTSLILAFLFDFLFYERTPGVSVPIFAGAAIGIGALLAYWFKRPMKTSTAWPAVLTIVFAGMIAFRGSPILVAANLAVAVYSIALLTAKIAGISLSDLPAAGYALLAVNELSAYISELISAGRRLSGEKSQKRSGFPARQVLLGIAITLPAATFATLMLASADAVFRKIAEQALLWPQGFVENFDFAQAVLIFSISLLLTGIFATILWRKVDGSFMKTEASSSRRQVLGFIPSSILLGTLDALFLVFIAIQFAYLFDGERNIRRLGLSYASYAHKGFFELVIVAVFSFAIIWFAERLSVMTRKQMGIFKVLGGALIGFVAVIMASAFKRLSLYEAVYGYTTLRVYTQLFIVALGVAFLLFFIKLIFEKSESWFSARILAFSVAFLIALNAGNPDALIARRNLDRFKENHNPDLLVYTKELSDDSTAELIESERLLKGTPAGEVLAKELRARFSAMKAAPWQSRTLSGSLAFSRINTWTSAIDAGKR